MKISANLSLLFKELPLLQRFEAARLAGFDAVETQSPYAESAADLCRAATDAGLPVVLINGPSIANTYPSGFAGRPEMRDEFRAQMPLVAEYASALNAQCVHIMAGVSLPEDREACLNTYVENLSFAAHALPGRQILIEFINPHDVPGYLNHQLPVALDLLRRCSGQVKLQFDVYHAARSELDIVRELAACLKNVAHIQFADSPGRHEPGTGTTPFDEILSMLRSAGYGGYLGAEYHPIATTQEGLKWLSAWRKERW